MGLDSVEILMKVEKPFGINIPDQEAEKIITVGDFHNSVWQRLQGNPVGQTLKITSLWYLGFDTAKITYIGI